MVQNATWPDSAEERFTFCAAFLRVWLEKDPRIELVAGFGNLLANLNMVMERAEEEGEWRTKWKLFSTIHQRGEKLLMALLLDGIDRPITTPYRGD